MTRPRLLDVFCGGGGCARGYDLAGFDVVGCDKESQKRYPYPFVQADALELMDALLAAGGFCASDGQRYVLADFAALHGSPPCQDGSVLRNLHKDKVYPKLIGATRERFLCTGLRYIIENVPPRKGAEERLIEPLLLCGTMFGLRTACGAELRRHRLFETNWFCDLLAVPLCQHGSDRTIGISGSGLPMTGARTYSRKRTISVYGDHPRDTAQEARNSRRVTTITGHSAQQNVVKNLIRETFPIEAAREAMGIDWMTMKELSQAIPPAYTRWIGERLLENLEAR